MTTPDLDVLPAIRRDADGPVFRAPWEAQAFAMAVSLSDRGYFSWSDWSARLASEIATAAARGEVDDGRRYYHHWLAALEGIVAERGIVPSQELETRRGEWSDAAAATPHGQPIVLPGR
jgi:nitrile hydratase accessory protein